MIELTESIARSTGPTGELALDHLFEIDLFVYLRDVYALLTALGLFGGFSVLLPYPSRELVLGTPRPIAIKVLPKAPHNATVSIPIPVDVIKERLYARIADESRHSWFHELLIRCHGDFEAYG